jgi:cellobiuronic acid synthase
VLGPTRPHGTVLTYLLEIRAWLQTGRVYPFAVFMTLVWALWLFRVTLGRFYRPATRRWDPTTSVVVPVVDEAVELFSFVLGRIVMQRPTEVIVVINGPRNLALEQVCHRLGVWWFWTRTPGKRNAVRIGVEAARGEIVVLVDSDTIWTADTLSELTKPFRDPRVGGVTTRQRILDPSRSVLTRWADWLESVRSEYSMPAMSALGTVGCLPGRTIAFRRKILLHCMEKFLRERFLGVFLEVSDDRALTNYTLKAGYRTVYQSTSLVYTDAPTELWKLVKQQYRWARGSQYNTLRMLPWMLVHTPILAILYISDIVVPFVLLGAFASWAGALATQQKWDLYADFPLPQVPWQALVITLGLALVMTLFSLAIRFGRHFAYRPQDLVYLPAFMLINTTLLIPIRIAGFFRMAHNAGWGTRSHGFRGEARSSPLIVIPYLLGSMMLLSSVMLSV